MTRASIIGARPSRRVSRRVSNSSLVSFCNDREKGDLCAEEQPADRAASEQSEEKTPSEHSAKSAKSGHSNPKVSKRRNSCLALQVGHIFETSVASLVRQVSPIQDSGEDVPASCKTSRYDQPLDELGYNKGAAKEEVTNGAHQVLQQVQQTSLLELGPRAVAAFAAEGLDVVRFREHVKAAMQENWSPHRIKLREVLDSIRFELAIGAVLFCNICMMIVEVNRRALCVDGRSSFCDPPMVDTILKYCFSVIYVSEVVGKIYVYRLSFHHNKWNLFDASLVFFTILVDFLDDFFEEFNNLKYFKILRAAKLLHTMLVFPAFFNLVHGLFNALTSIVSAFILLMFLLLIWSIAAVLVLHPINTRIASMGGFVDCPRCASAFSSVPDAFVTLVQTTLSGDSWGKFATPTIEESPWTIILFLGIYMTVVLGMLNVVTASTVDCTVDARKQDEAFRKQVHEIVTAVEKEVLLGICGSMDVDGNGTISLAELEDAYAHNEGFRKACQRVEVDKEKLGMMIKLAGISGCTSNYEEDPEILITDFVEAMMNKESTEDKSMIMLLHEEMDDIRESLSEDIKSLAHMVQSTNSNLTKSFENTQKETKQVIDRVIDLSMRRAIKASPSNPTSPTAEKNEDANLSFWTSTDHSARKKVAFNLHAQHWEPPKQPQILTAVQHNYETCASGDIRNDLLSSSHEAAPDEGTSAGEVPHSNDNICDNAEHARDEGSSAVDCALREATQAMLREAISTPNETAPAPPDSEPSVLPRCTNVGPESTYAAKEGIP